ncbi:MAG: guanylate kinase [Planctomycetota bacterium]|nr:MAG: guanylate kinase [Planctomycetota bacterium]
MTDDSSQPVRVVVLSGPSGSGKSTIVQRLIRECPVPIRQSISATTRAPRPGEVDGEHYHFLTLAEFETQRKNGEFLECAEVHRTGNWYGTLWSEVDVAQKLKMWSLLEIDVEGAQSVMRMYPHAITIFVTLPSLDEYERRLRARGTESEEVLQRRLQTAREELKMAGCYRHQIVNDDLDTAVQAICRILATHQAEINAR